MSTLETPVGNRVLEEEEITEAAEPHQGSKAKRARMDLTPYKPTLEEYWERGMQTTKSTLGKELLEEVVQRTGLTKKIVKDWIGNKKTKFRKQNAGPSTSSSPSTSADADTFSITRQRAISGYNLFKREFFRGKSGNGVTTQAASAWRGMGQEQKAAYNSRAANMKPAVPQEISEDARERELNKLQSCGCDAYFMAVNHNTNKAMQHGTDAGLKYMAEKHPDLLWEFGTSVSGGDQDDTKKMMQDEVMDLLTQKWPVIRGNQPLSNAKLRRGEIALEGLPENFAMAKPREMGVNRLRKLFACKDRIVVKVKESIEEDPQAPSGAEERLQALERNIASVEAGTKYVLDEEDVPLSKLPGKKNKNKRKST
ncbi:hypothetical protein Bbelb_109560 [Branchiostoma belcheri]|nr:hypothetical protein Bbelb_109560 [Branchiostoma belcheri]